MGHLWEISGAFPLTLLCPDGCRGWECWNQCHAVWGEEKVKVSARLNTGVRGKPIRYSGASMSRNYQWGGGGGGKVLTLSKPEAMIRNAAGF